MRVRVNFVCLLAALCGRPILSLTSQTGSSSVGYRGRVTRHGLNYASQVAVDALMKFLPAAEIPDLYQQLGGMSVVLANVSLTDFRRPSLQIGLIPGTNESLGGLKALFTGLDPTIECHMTMTYEWGFFSSTRELFVSIATSNLTMALEGSIGSDAEGNAVVGELGCQMAGNVQMASKGEEKTTFSGIFDFMTSTWNDRMKEMMFSQACQNITSLINSTVRNQMSAANMSRIALDDDFLLDLKFTDSPKVTDSYIETSHTARLFLTTDSNDTHQQLETPVIPSLAQHSVKMLYAFISDRFINSAWDAAQRRDKLRFTVTTSTPHLPKSVHRYLSTTCTKGALCFASLFPQLKNLYPRASIELDLAAAPSDERVFRTRGRTLLFKVPGVVHVYVPSNNSRDLIHSVSTVLTGTIKVATNHHRVFFNVTNLNLNVNASGSSKSRFSVKDSKLTSFFKNVNRRLLLPQIRELGSKGYSINIPQAPWFKLINPSIIDPGNQNFLVLATDIDLDVSLIPDF